MIIGSHVSLNSKDGLLGSVIEALSYNANCFMVYTGAPQNTIRKPIESFKIDEAKELMKENNIDLKNLIIHAPYVVNPASSDINKHDFAINFLTNEVIRTNKMGSSIIVLHPGNSLELTLSEAIKNIADVINNVIENTKDINVIIALETMAGKGSEVGRNFNEIKDIIELINNKNRIGVCLDTCHIHDAGYDIVNNYEKVIKEFDDIIGIRFLKVIHINDSKNICGSHKDRHENIDKGYIGLNTILKFANDERFKNIPKILETPYINGVPPYKEEIELIKNSTIK